MIPALSEHSLLPMPQCRVVKGGWYWKGEQMVAGQILDAPSAQWIANRVADGGLVEAIAEPTVVAAPAAPASVEAAAVAPAETATVSRPAKRKA